MIGSESAESKFGMGVSELFVGVQPENRFVEGAIRDVHESGDGVGLIG